MRNGVGLPDAVDDGTLEKARAVFLPLLVLSDPLQQVIDSRWPILPASTCGLRPSLGGPYEDFPVEECLIDLSVDRERH